MVNVTHVILTFTRVAHDIPPLTKLGQLDAGDLHIDEEVIAR